jgi:two-component system, NtrC family, sensor kinase
MPQRKESLHGTFIIRHKCRRCLYCIQICPAKAIKLEKDNIRILPERCVLCGTCIDACPHGALAYKSSIEDVRKPLQAAKKTVAILDASFPVVLGDQTPRQFVTALRRAGFTEVWEGAFGVELVSRAYRKLLTLEGFSRDYPGHRSVTKTLISSFCPVIVSYIQKYFPSLIPSLVPIVSPMIAIGRVARALKGPGWKLVYITSCLGQMGEMIAPEVRGAIDQVITFGDAKRLIADAGIDQTALDETDFDGPRPYLGRVASLIGGLSRSMDVNFDVLMDEISVTYGHKRAIGALNQLAAGQIRARFLDLTYCDGCIDGPFVDSALSLVGRRQIVARYIETEMNKQNPQAVTTEAQRYEATEIRREFLNMEQRLPTPTENEIRAILKKIDKLPPSKNLDCRACGYATCREKAVAVAQGMAEAEYCLPYLLERSRKIYQQLDKSHRELQLSHQELEQAHSQLIRTEKLASLGQLSAGVAHEINNPLGTIMIYTHLLLKGLDAEDPRREDVDLIIKEATRAKDIVQGLLSFARERKLSPGQLQVNELLDDVLGLVGNQSLFHNIHIKKVFYPELPTIFADETQLKQVFLNIILNAAQAMEGKGKLTISTAADTKFVKTKIADTGPGIPPEDMGRLFSPFFTTKEKGTGLGLAISYGIVERHSGKIDVQSEYGKGSTFIVSLPFFTEKEEGQEETGSTYPSTSQTIHLGR